MSEAKVVTVEYDANMVSSFLAVHDDEEVAKEASMAYLCEYYNGLYDSPEFLTEPNEAVRKAFAASAREDGEVLLSDLGCDLSVVNFSLEGRKAGLAKGGEVARIFRAVSSIETKATTLRNIYDGYEAGRVSAKLLTDIIAGKRGAVAEAKARAKGEGGSSPLTFAKAKDQAARNGKAAAKAGFTQAQLREIINTYIETAKASFKVTADLSE